MDNETKQEIFSLLKNSESFLQPFRDVILNKNITVFLGNTRSGKSTTVNYLIGTELESFMDEDVLKYRIRVKNNSKLCPVIGHGSLSTTSIPKLCEIPGEDFIYMDAPGFDDNRGVVQDIVNSAYINQLEHCNSVKFVLVSDINDIVSDNVSRFLDLIEKVEMLIPDLNKMKESFSIIFTKDRDGYTLSDIAQLLKHNVCNVRNKELIRYFVENQTAIGVLTMPTSLGIITDEIDHNVKTAINKSVSKNLQEANLRFGLSTATRNILLETYLDFYDIVIELKNLLNNIGSKFTEVLNFIIEEFQFNCKCSSDLDDAKTALLVAKSNLDGRTVTKLEDISSFLKNVIDPTFVALTTHFNYDQGKVTDFIKSVEPKIAMLVQKFENIEPVEKLLQKDGKTNLILNEIKELCELLTTNLRNSSTYINDEIKMIKQLKISYQDVQNTLNIFDTAELDDFASSDVDELNKFVTSVNEFEKCFSKLYEEFSKRSCFDEVTQEMKEKGLENCRKLIGTIKTAKTFKKDQLLDVRRGSKWLKGIIFTAPLFYYYCKNSNDYTKYICAGSYFALISYMYIKFPGLCFTLTSWFQKAQTPIQKVLLELYRIYREQNLTE